MRTLRLACMALLFTATSCVADGPDVEDVLKQPEPKTETFDATSSSEQVAAQTEETPEEVGEVYKVKFETTKGDFVIEVNPDWAPKGAAQFKAAVQDGVYDNAKFFRVVDGFMVQFGIPGDPEKAAKWRAKRIQDDPVKQSNSRGMVTFAMAGPNTRTTQVFISFGDNSFLNSQGFAPFGKVVEGMDVVDSLYKGYGEAPSQAQQQIQQQGNEFLEKKFPNLDTINKATVIESKEAGDSGDEA